MSNMLIESNFEDIELLEESETGERKLYIQGIFIQSDVVNRNRRIYPDGIMEKEVSRYSQEYIATGRAIGELNHPPTPEVNPERASHRILEIRKEGSSYLGKALILNTPTGNIVKGLLEGGVRLGVSSRGMGSVKKNSSGINEVQDNFKLTTVDIVSTPSAPDAFVSGLMENADFIWNTTEEDKEFLESIKQDVLNTNKTMLAEKKLAVFEEFLNRLKQS